MLLVCAATCILYIQVYKKTKIKSKHTYFFILVHFIIGHFFEIRALIIEIYILRRHKKKKKHNIIDDNYAHIKSTT